MKNTIALAFALLSLNSFARVGNDQGNGGDPVALDFEASAAAAIREVQANVTAYPGLSTNLLMPILQHAQILVSEAPLYAIKDGVKQESAAINSKNPDLITIDRERWNAIQNAFIRKALAFHEVLSLAGLETTGKYDFSSRYLEMNGLQCSANLCNLQDDLQEESVVARVDDPRSYDVLNGSTVQLLKPLKFPPNARSILLQGGHVVEQIDHRRPYCGVILNHPSPSGRSISARRLKVTSVEPVQDPYVDCVSPSGSTQCGSGGPGNIYYNYYYVALLTANDPDIQGVECGEAKLGYQASPPSNQDVHDALSAGLVETGMPQAGMKITNIPASSGDVSATSAHGCGTRIETSTWSKRCDITPGAAVGSCSGFTQTEIEADEYQVETEAQAKYGRENVISVDVSRCNYHPDQTVNGYHNVNLDYYCDFSVTIRDCGN